jgi:basic membrane protein A
MKRKNVVLVALVVLLLVIGLTAPVSAGKTRVGVAYDSPLGDLSFNDMTHEGVVAAQEDFPIKVREMSPLLPNGKVLTFDEVVKRLSSPSDLVIAVGFLYTDALATQAAKRPKVDFAIIDSVVDAPNVASLLFAAHEGSFLVGAAAALTSQTGTIGFIGGVDIPVIYPFEAGFVAGVEYVDPDATVLVDYISEPPDFSGFGDPERAYLLATDMYEAGADVVFHAAGFSGVGLFQAAHDYSMANEHVWAIGVDADQYLTMPAELQPYILTSMRKRVDVATYDIIAAEVNGTFEGGIHVYDLAAGGVGYATSGGFVDGIVPQLEAIKALIIDGSITVPTVP